MGLQHLEWKWPLSFETLVLGTFLFVFLEKSHNVPGLIRIPRFSSPFGDGLPFGICGSDGGVGRWFNW